MDLDRIEVTGENTFTEYDKAGYSLRFTVTVREPCTRLEFSMENENLQGSWIGVFRDLGGKATGEEEGIYIASIDLDLLQEYRKNEIMGAAWRHPEKYTELISAGKITGEQKL